MPKAFAAGRGVFGVRLNALLALLLLGDVLIKQLPDHFLVLRVMLFRSCLEKRHALRTQRNRDFGLLILQRQFLR